MVKTFCKSRLEVVMGPLTAGQYRYLLTQWAAFSEEPEKYRNLVPMIKEYMKAAGMLAA